MIVNFSKYSDTQLVELLSQDKATANKAFAEIYDRYGVRLNAYIRTIMGDKEKSEDIFQETFIKFYQNINPEMMNSSLIGFLIRIARNLCLNAKRDSKQMVSIDNFQLPSFDNQNLENKEFNELLTMSIDLLDSELKECLVLRYFDELHYDEISEILHITPARARYLVFTAKQKLKKMLNPYFEETYKQ